MHKYVKEKYSYSVPLTITTDETWDFAIKMYQDIVITNNTTLTITGEVKMPINGKIIVQPGSKLVIDGGRITSAHSQPWQGIEVWGNSSIHQYTVNGSYGQGYLELKNGAVIENAICAVELWRPNYWNTTGGIIHASDAIFRNNTMAIHVPCYSNYIPTTHFVDNYNAYFNNCSFIIDNNYLGIETFYRHVVLSDVKGIRFSGCDFSANRAVNGVNPWCVGIRAYDASFIVNATCLSIINPCPEEDYDFSTFTGLGAGIRVSSNGNNTFSFSVRRSIFNNNDIGIYAQNYSFPTIIQNDFNIGQGACQFTYGIYLNAVSSFCIEENNFHASSNLSNTTVGIAIYDSYGINDVYRNSFNGLSCGNMAWGHNTSNSNMLGLTYSCNTNSGNRSDFRVFQIEGYGDIQCQQGSSALPAGNTFDASDHQFDNQGSQPIDYYYYNSNPDEKPESALVFHVNTFGTNNVNPCLSHYGNNSIVKSPSEKTVLESEYLSAYSTYIDFKRLYDTRIDGGSTSTQIANINTASPADLWQLRTRLLGLSPYVSGEVLTAAADREDIFIDPVLFEILAANPDELKNDKLINYLESKEHPLPSYMISLLRQLSSNITTRTALISQMGVYSHQYRLAAGDIVRSNLNDSIANPTELRQWLGNMNDIAADRMVIASYLQEGDSVSAFTLANMLPDLYGLQGDQLSDHADYIRLIQLYQILNRTHRTMYELTATEMNMVNDIAEEGVGVSRLMAKSLQEMVSGEITEICLDPEIPESMNESKGWATIGQSSMDNAMGFMVSVSPNPATTWAVVDYTMPSKMSKASVVITNTLGVTMMSTELNGDQGQKVLDLRDLSDGVYFVRVTDGEKHSKIVKLVKQK